MATHFSFFGSDEGISVPLAAFSGSESDVTLSVSPSAPVLQLLSSEEDSLAEDAEGEESEVDGDSMGAAGAEGASCLEDVSARDFFDLALLSLRSARWTKGGSISRDLRR